MEPGLGSSRERWAAGVGERGPTGLGEAGSCPPTPAAVALGVLHCGCDTLLFSGTPRGPPRRPPPHILDQVKGLNQSLRLGHLLCRSRNPDFLLNIIQRQVSSAVALGGEAQGGLGAF